MKPISFSWRRHLPKRIYVLVIAHLLLFTLSYDIAFQLRFDMAVPAEARKYFWKTLPWLLALKLGMFHYFGSLHGWWRYITFSDLAALLRVSTLATLTIAFVDYLFIHTYQIPRSVLLLDWGITILLVGGLRSACRLVREILVACHLVAGPQAGLADRCRARWRDSGAPDPHASQTRFPCGRVPG